MPRLILKCPYLKGGSERASAHLENLVNYIATRDGVEKIRVEDKNLSSTIKQEELIAQIIKEFPNTKNLFEYEDYIQNSTIENASEFISVALEQNFDKIGKRKNYVDYIANRPNVEKMGKHGLFTGGNDDLVLNRIVNEVANYAKTSVERLIRSGIIKGSNNLINPRSNASRAEAAVVLYRLYNN